MMPAASPGGSPGDAASSLPALSSSAAWPANAAAAAALEVAAASRRRRSSSNTSRSTSGLSQGASSSSDSRASSDSSSCSNSNTNDSNSSSNRRACSPSSPRFHSLTASHRGGLQYQSPRQWPPRAAALLSSPQQLSSSSSVERAFDPSHACSSSNSSGSMNSSTRNNNSSGSNACTPRSRRSLTAPNGGALPASATTAAAGSATAAATATAAVARPPQIPAGGARQSKVFTVRAERLHAVLSREDVDTKELKELLWSGVPTCCPASIRSDAWRIVLGYLPASRERACHVLVKKRREYVELLQHYYEKETLSVDEAKLLRQLRVDLPRTHSGLHFFTHPRMQRCMERALFLWAVKHPASGYVQGINDLLTPFLAVFLASALDTDFACICVDEIPADVLTGVEADAFWCLSRLLAHIQDNFTFGQPGIQRSIVKLTNIVKRVDEPLYAHLTSQGVELLQVSFRWMNCLLMREFPLRCIIRLWDTYIAEQAEGFSSFHVYVCAVFLVNWSSQLRSMNFQQIMLFIQNFPTAAWTEQEVETLLAEAFVLKSLFHASPKHLGS